MNTLSKSSIKDELQILQDSCFVVMPFGGWHDNYYLNIYKPAIEEAGLTPMRADDIYRPSTIIKDIWELTNKATIILADLTGKNPNVFYELGLAHALAKPAILITESMEYVPFDLRALRILEFDKNHFEWGAILRQKIIASIKETIKSPLESVLPAFLEISDEVKQTGKVTQQEKELIELKQDIEFIKSNIRSNKPYSDRLLREKDIDVIRLFNIGLGIKEIAEKFDITISEVNSMLTRIHNITSTSSMGELLDWAKENKYC
jgi:DNA-binding CsgD family transcriptional regulator